MFGNQNNQKDDDENGDGSDGGVQPEDEAPIYAETGNDKVEFKKGVEI